MVVVGMYITAAQIDVQMNRDSSIACESMWIITYHVDLFFLFSFFVNLIDVQIDRVSAVTCESMWIIICELMYVDYHLSCRFFILLVLFSFFNWNCKPGSL